MEQQEKNKMGRPQKSVPIQLSMVTQKDENYMKELNHMVPTILMETHNMATKIEDEPLLW